jgi:hypothetical protein
MPVINQRLKMHMLFSSTLYLAAGGNSNRGPFQSERALVGRIGQATTPPRNYKPSLVKAILPELKLSSER